MMKVTRRSPLTGVLNTLELNIDQYGYDAWKKGALIQDVFPNLTVDEREFILSGLLPNEWEELFSEDEE